MNESDIEKHGYEKSEKAQLLGLTGNTFTLDVPLTEVAVSKLRIGDLVYLNGLVFTGRAGVYSNILDKKIAPPIDLAANCNVQFHCAPAGGLNREGEYVIAAAQATASFRYYRWVPDFIKKFKIRAIIGKGGMQDWLYQTTFREEKCVFLTTIGFGLLSSLYAKAIKKVRDIYWKEELGLPEAMWILEVKKFGPFIVDGDTLGQGLFSSHNLAINERLTELYVGQPELQLKRLGERTKPTEEVI